MCYDDPQGNKESKLFVKSESDIATCAACKSKRARQDHGHGRRLFRFALRASAGVNFAYSNYKSPYIRILVRTYKFPPLYFPFCFVRPSNYLRMVKTRFLIQIQIKKE
jgi:hypothetical protein